MEAAESDEQVVLEELYDENYEPTEAEILEYAKWLGMDTDNEKELLWIARAGLKEPVPEGWKPCQAPSKEIYYFNFITGESIWDHPCDERFRKLYAQEKERLEERRQLAAGQQPNEPVPAQQLQWQDPQEGPQGQQPPRVPKLLLPSNNVVQHTVVEPLQIPLASPSGTLSTIASATTVSVVESPVGGLAQGPGPTFLEHIQQQDAVTGRASLTNRQAGDDGGGLQQPAAVVPDAAGRMTITGSAGSGSSADVALTASAGWQAEVAAADQQERLQFRQHLDEERHLWEQHMQAELHAQHAGLHEQHQQRLWSLTQELQEHERQAAAQLKAEQDARLTCLRSELQTTLKSLEQELQDAKAQHAAHMEQLRRQHAELEVRASSMLQQAQQRLSQTTLTDSELSAARDKVAAAAEIEAMAEAAGHRSELLQSAIQRVEQELAVEVAAYKSTRRAETLKQLAGHLSEDTAAAAEQLQTQTAELQRLESAVADRAAVLQKLNDELASKQQQQQLHKLTSFSEHAGDGQLLGGTVQLAAVQQQLAQAEKQLAAADTALVARRAAVTEADEQLAAVRREVSVCEPRLSSLRQQLQELDSNIRAREMEYQQRQADVALSTKRLQDLREEVTRRQSQLESLEALYSERQESLRQTANELAWRRGELSTLESSLSESLRRKADTEFHALEEQLRRTRKSAADVASELSARQVALSDVTSQLASKQVQLEGVEASLAGKSKELADVLAQLQAAAAQEFQDAKKLLLAEEARLLDSERRSMQLRVADQIESEQRAALAAGRRRFERHLSAQLAGEQSASLEHQQKQVKRWLEAAGVGMQSLDSSLKGISGGSLLTNGKQNAAARSHAALARIPSGVGAVLGDSSAWQPSSAEQQQEQQQQQPCTGNSPGSVHSMPDTSMAAGGDEQHGDLRLAAADRSSSRRRRARSYSPVRQRQTAAVLNGGRPSIATCTAAELTRGSQLQRGPKSTGVGAAAGHANSPLAQSVGLQASGTVHQASWAAGGVAAGLQAAAAAVVSQLRALSAHQGDGGGDASSSGSSHWLDVLESNLQSAAGLHAASQAHGSPQLPAYSSLLQHTKQFIKQRRHDIQARQEAVMAAQADWKSVLAAMEEQQRLQQVSGAAVPPELSQAVQQLRQLKGVLQDQIHSLNDETQQVKSLKARMQQLKATIELLQLHAPQQGQQPDPTVSTLSSLLTSLSGLQDKQQQWQQEQERHKAQRPERHKSPALSPSYQPGQHQQWQRQQEQQQGSSLYRASPLEKVAAALQSALDAATSWNHAGGEPASSSLPHGGSSQPPGGCSPSAAILAGSSRRSSLQPWPHGASALKPLQQNGQLPGLAAEGSWGTLNKLRQERGAAQRAMHQHSQWLQSFREQVAQVAALQPAVATKLQQSQHSLLRSAPPAAPAAAAVWPKQAAAAEQPPEHGAGGGAGGLEDAGAGGGYGGSVLSPVASSSLLPMASAGSLTMGHPLTVDLGGDQELVISVVHKASVT